MLSEDIAPKHCSVFTETGLDLLYFETKKLMKWFLIDSHFSAFQVQYFAKIIPSRFGSSHCLNIYYGPILLRQSE